VVRAGGEWRGVRGSLQARWSGNENRRGPGCGQRHTGRSLAIAHAGAAVLRVRFVGPLAGIGRIRVVGVGGARVVGPGLGRGQRSVVMGATMDLRRLRHLEERERGGKDEGYAPREG
jgi:hypothetical protein